MLYINYLIIPSISFSQCHDSYTYSISPVILEGGGGGAALNGDQQLIFATVKPALHHTIIHGQNRLSICVKNGLLT